jgi:hypothetical protein
MKLPDEHGDAMVNGSVQLELRGVANGVSAAVWQLACEGVRARDHARAPFVQGEQGSTLSGAGVREQNVDGKRERPGAVKVDRDNALCGGDAVLRTEDHGQERGLLGDDEKVGGEGLSSHEVWPQKGEALALACVSEQIAGGERERPGADKVGRRGSIREARTPQHVLGCVLSSLVCGEEACAVVSIGRPKAASMSSLERVGISVPWPRRRAPRWHTGVFAYVRACGQTHALTWPDARAPRRPEGRPRR